MKAFQTIKYLAFAGAATLWSCSSQQYAQKQATEYDDLYFSSADKKEVVYTASTSNNNYTTGNTGVAPQDNSQKNVNPEYIQQYADQSRTENEQDQTNGSDTYSADENYSYYDENYRRGDGGGVNLARQYNRNQSGVNVNFFPSYGFGAFNRGPAFYDPFYDPFFYGSAYYDPFFYRPFVRIRPGIIVNIGAGFGMGWGSWGGGWYDPFYSRMYDPFYGGYAYDSWGRPFFGGYGYNSFYNPYRYGYGGGNNVVIVNPSNGNNNDRRTVRYSPRTGRSSGVVNDNFDNSPRSGRAERGGRVDQSVDGNSNSGRGSSNPNISSDGSRPARAVRPRSENTPDSYNNPQRSSQDVNAGGSRTYSPNVNGDNNSNRAVRPRGNDSYDNNRSRNNTYYDNSSNSNRSSAPTYSSPSPSSGRSPRSYDNYSTPRNNNSGWDNSNSGGRSGGSYNSGGGSYSSPSPSSSPRGGDGGSGSRSPRSSR